MEDFLVIENLRRRFGSIRALDGLSMHVPRDTTTAFIGANGAGKTTTFSLIGEFIRCHGGKISIADEPLRHFRRHGGLIGILPQDMQYFENRSVRRQLALFAALAGMSSKQARREAERVLDIVNLRDRAKDRVETLSRGMRVRLGVAQALIGTPPLVLLDEPMAGLDPKMRANFRECVEAIRGTTTLMISSHELGELEELCDYVCIIDKGRLVREGQMGELLRDEMRVVYQLEFIPDGIEALEQELPGVNYSTQGEQKLVAEFDPDEYEVADVNSYVLSWLLEREVGILDVRSAESLEAIFLKATGERAEK